MPGKVSEKIEALQSADYRAFALMYAWSNLALWVFRIAAGWLMWSLTGATSWLGALALAEFLPLVLCNPAAGALADRHDVRRICVAAELSLAAAVGATLACHGVGVLGKEILLALSVAVGVANAVGQPTQITWFPVLVRDAGHIGSATSLNLLVFNLTRFAGPALAGAVIAHGSAGAVLLLSLVFYAASVATMLRIPARPPQAGRAGTRPPFWQATLGGYGYVAGHRHIWLVFLLIAITAVGARGIPDLAPAIAATSLGASAAGFPMLVSAAGLGAVCGCAWNVLRQRQRSADGALRLLAAFAAALGATACALAAASSLWSGAACFFMLGFCVTSMAIGAQTAIQSSVEQAYRGRVNAIYFLTYRGGTALGAFLMGVLAPSVGLGPVIVGGGLLCAAAWLLAGRFVRGNVTAAAENRTT